MRSRLVKWIAGIRNMRIVSKLIVGYILLIVVPFTLFAWFVYDQTSSNLLAQYRSDREKYMGQQLNNLKVELSKIESMFPLFQNNDQLVEYLEGRYNTDWEMIYYYRKAIVPTISFAYTSSEHVNKITIYKQNANVLSLNDDIVDAAASELPGTEEQLRMLQPGKGIWTREDGGSAVPRFYYIETLYNNIYTQQLGYLTVELSGSMLSRMFGADDGDGHWVGYAGSDGRYAADAEPPVELPAIASASWPEKRHGEAIRSFYTPDNRYLAHQIYIPKLDLTILDITPVTLFVSSWNNLSWMVTFGVALLAVLSIFYFMIASSLANRLIRFSRYLKRVDHPRLAVYAGHSGNDEIGFLITSYNAMIRRMEELTNHYHQSEILKREAEIRMLQAQINPHFIYNTLETMRMMALLKGQSELADMASSLGSLLRYNLAGNKDEAAFVDELNHVRNYIEIHKVRMGERLDYTIEVRADIDQLKTPRFILQPIVENSIKHGLGRKRGKGVLTLTVDETPGDYWIRVADNGAGMTAERLEELREMLAGRLKPKAASFGIGLHNVHERVKSYFGESSGIAVESEDGEGAVFTLRLNKRGAVQRAEIADRG